MDAQIPPAAAAATAAELLTRTAPASAPAAGRVAVPVAESAPPEKPRESEESTRPKVAEALERIQKFVEPMASDLQFSVDESSGMRVVKVLDRATQEVIRQIPSAEVLEIAKALDRLQGLLLKQKA